MKGERETQRDTEREREREREMDENSLFKVNFDKMIFNQGCQSEEKKKSLIISK